MSSGNVVTFRDRSAPAEGAERLTARRIYREVCKDIATEYMEKAFTAAGKAPGVGNLGIDDAYLLFVVAMRRELRRSGFF